MQMDRQTDVTHNVLERMVLDASAEPTDLPLSLLKDITNNFSRDQLIGRGGTSDVYKGLLRNGVVAVKKLNETLDILEKNFIKEVDCLMKTKHKNIVRFMGYCSDTRAIIEDNGEEVAMADVRQWLLCFEYLPKGSLRKYISGASCALGWTKCYEIIKGICKGLQYLHVNQHIVHLDLKPENILLNDNMVPKIADFGISRYIGENQSQSFTSNPEGTTGYVAPECLGGHITFSSDIYSLGVIIREIVTGKKGHRDIVDVLNFWKEKLEQSFQDMQIEQIRVCMEIGIDCAKNSPTERPDIQSIIDRLNGTENIDTSAPNTVQGVASSEVMSTTFLVLAGKSSEDEDLLASAATSLSLFDSELSVSVVSNVSGFHKDFDARAYMSALLAHRFGTRILWSPRISSTHDLVSENFAKLPVGAVCVADTQFKGRGRSRNVWQSPPGCLMFSFTLRMDDAQKMIFLQYVSCIALIEAINELLCAKGFPELDVKIKWPNDIYLTGLKVGGILCTSSYRRKGYNICIGIGLNVDNKNPTTCLNAALRKLKANSSQLEREEILASFFNKFEVLFEILSHEGFHALEERYYNAWLHSGQIVLVQDVNEGQSVESVVTIEGLTQRGYLYGFGEDGKQYELEPSRNSFDFFTGLVRKKM